MEEKKRRKAEYDREVRNDPVRGAARRKKRNEAYYANHEESKRRDRERRANLTPEQYAKYRACQDRCQSTDDWKKRKKQYDREWKARRDYGPLAEAQVALLDLNDEISSRMSRSEIYVSSGYYNKTQERRRDAIRCQKAKN